jgi:hypothetical protein
VKSLDINETGVGAKEFDTQGHLLGKLGVLRHARGEWRSWNQ